ncbi:hypothetical protein D3C75_1128750 [compost metagenome]
MPLHSVDLLGLRLGLTAYRLHQKVMNLLIHQAVNRMLKRIFNHINWRFDRSDCSCLLANLAQGGLLHRFPVLHLAFRQRNFAVPVHNELNFQTVRPFPVDYPAC